MIIKRIIGRVTAFARAETGQSAVIVALLMTVICGFAALAIDLGYGYYQKNDSEQIVIYWQGDDRLSGETQEKMEESVRGVDPQAKVIKLL